VRHSTRALPHLVAALALALALPPALSWSAGSGSDSSAPETALSGIFAAIEENRLDLALARVETLSKEHPNFRLAHLIRGDLLLARTHPLETFGNVSGAIPRSKVDELRDEALARLKAMRERPPASRVPRYVLQLAPEQKHALIVDSARSRLYVFANRGGRPALMADYYVTLGKRGVEKTREGDQKTPLGVYHVTGNLSRRRLTDFYGAGAFPINYPNEWDRQLGRNGYGIWLHGTPSDTYSRPPRASDGCIVLSNPDLESVARYVQVGITPVIIADEIEWTDADVLDLERKSLADNLEAWRADWESRDVDRYLRHYSRRFRSGDRDLAAWAAYKRRVNSGKSWIRVGVSRVGMFRYPRQGDFVVVVFDQNYRSQNYSNVMRKRQYWIREDGSWKIVHEGPA